MRPPSPSPRSLPRAAAWAALPVALTIVYATQLKLAGNAATWSGALWLELVYWTSWCLIAVGISRGCRFVHSLPCPRGKIVLFLIGGALLAMALHPLLYQALRFGTNWLGWQLGIVAEAPAPFTTGLRRVFIGLLGPSLVLYTGTLLGWHAWRYYRDAQERQVKSAQLEALLQQAQLHALRSQLHPHFLFNTLHSIAELMHDDPARAELMLLRLAGLLRQALRSSGAAETTLAEETDFVRDYLEIEQLRLGDRLQITWDIAPETHAARVPALLLQPLVENAIQHGIAPLARPGTLLIRTRRDGDFLEVCVRDNGAGLRAAAGAPPEHGRRDSGVGLANTRARLARLHGARHEFELIDDHGVTVRVRLPFVRNAAVDQTSSSAPAANPGRLSDLVKGAADAA